MLDLPGQVEIFTHHESLRRILGPSKSAVSASRACISSSAFHCSDPHKIFRNDGVTANDAAIRASASQRVVKVDLIQCSGAHFTLT